jgi:hypothetical protein
MGNSHEKKTQEHKNPMKRTFEVGSEIIVQRILQYEPAEENKQNAPKEGVILF